MRIGEAGKLGCNREDEISNWAAPIITVPKPDGGIRICGDYKVTINPILEVDQYPVPKAEDLFATLAGGEKFTKLDLSHTYQQVLLSEESRQYVTVNTHKGLYQYNRLPSQRLPYFSRQWRNCYMESPESQCTLMISW